MSTKRYRLLKDIDWFGKPIKAGTIYAPHGNDYYWPVTDYGAHQPSSQLNFYTVHNNPEWFSEIFDKTEVIDINFDCRKKWMEFFLNNEFSADDIKRVKHAIESALNNPLKEEQIDTQKYLSDIMKNVIKNEERLRWSDRKKTKDRDWEIVEFVMTKSYGYIGAHNFLLGGDGKYRAAIGEPKTFDSLLNHPDVKIHSVKRLSDNETFSAGDNIGVDGVYAKISGFVISQDEIRVELEGGGFWPFIKISKVPAQPQPQPTKERIEVKVVPFYYGEKIVKIEIRKEGLLGVLKHDEFVRISQAIESALNGNNEVTFLSEYAGESFQYGFYSAKPIQPNQFEFVSKAIEVALNDTQEINIGNSHQQTAWETVLDYLKEIGLDKYKKDNHKNPLYHVMSFIKNKLYTEQKVDEIEEAAFLAGRKCKVGYMITAQHIYTSYYDYKKSKA